MCLDLFIEMSGFCTKTVRFCIENIGFCSLTTVGYGDITAQVFIQTNEFCAKNDEFCIKNDITAQTKAEMVMSCGEEK